MKFIDEAMAFLEIQWMRGGNVVKETVRGLDLLDLFFFGF
jgi:hypothetical protein